MSSPKRARAATRASFPTLPAGLDLENANGKDYLACMGSLLGVDEDGAVQGADARDRPQPTISSTDNYLSNELRVPSTLLQTNACSPLATNALAGNIWDNFSSASYKELPSVGTVTVRHPVTGAAYDYPLPGGGRGFTRPASLVSLWSTAPYLQNNTVGRFNPSPSVDARMGVVPGLDRKDAVAGAARKGSYLQRQFAGRRHHRSHQLGQRALDPAGVRAGEPAAAARYRALRLDQTLGFVDDGRPLLGGRRSFFPTLGEERLAAAPDEIGRRAESIPQPLRRMSRRLGHLLPLGVQLAERRAVAARSDVLLVSASP